jgi:hypothetical protein
MTLYIQIVKSIKNIIQQFTNPIIELSKENEKTEDKSGDLLV